MQRQRIRHFGEARAADRGFRARAADQLGRNIRLHFLHDTRLERRPVQRPAAFEQHAVDLFAAEPRHQVTQVDPAAVRRALPDGRASRTERVGFLPAAAGVRHDQRDCPRGAYQRRVQGDAQMAVAHHADGVAPDPQRVVLDFHAAGERGVVGEHRADADHDRRKAVAGLMGVGAGFRAADPAAVAGVRRDLAVERHRVFEDNKRAFCRNIVKEHFVLPLAFVFQHAGVDRHAVGAQDLRAFAGDLFVGVHAADHDPGDFVL